jgi:putative SOS response-associated peptidase YedK
VSLRSCDVSRSTHRLALDYSEIKIRLKFAPDAPAPNYEADYNKPLTMPMLVAMRSVDGRRVLQMMKWGLVPYNIAGMAPPPWWAASLGGRAVAVRA